MNIIEAKNEVEQVLEIIQVDNYTSSNNVKVACENKVNRNIKIEIDQYKLNKSTYYRNGNIKGIIRITNIETADSINVDLYKIIY